MNKAHIENLVKDFVNRQEIREMLEDLRNASVNYKDHHSKPISGSLLGDEDRDYPLYFASGEMVDPPDGYLPSYYKVHGQDGPVVYRNPGTKSYPTTMVDLILEAKGNNHFRQCSVEDTPFEVEDE